ncbi:hypothetical protein HPB51_011856 [Rhipicephalus microplus]|uniref:Uncharacterized protein n=1 Tax=Rhipicephalus microplus TaxID=6941 RepID=A0A9J6E950_RHIMP|nr:hypothetical protein HPB51_011856 [Rhipicephalus microplus]
MLALGVHTGSSASCAVSSASEDRGAALQSESAELERLNGSVRIPPFVCRLRFNSARLIDGLTVLLSAAVEQWLWRSAANPEVGSLIPAATVAFGWRRYHRDLLKGSRIRVVFPAESRSNVALYCPAAVVYCLRVKASAVDRSRRAFRLDYHGLVIGEVHAERFLQTRCVELAAAGAAKSLLWVWERRMSVRNCEGNRRLTCGPHHDMPWEAVNAISAEAGMNAEPKGLTSTAAASALKGSPPRFSQRPS